MQFEFSHGKIEKILKVLESLEVQGIIKNKLIEIPVEKRRKFDVIKEKLKDVKTLSVQTTQIVVNFVSRDYNFKLAVGEVKGKLRAFDRPEKIEFTSEVQNLMLMNNNKVILHPLTFQTRFKIAQEYWKVDPMMHVNIDANFLRVNVNPDILQQAKSLQSSLQEVFDRRKKMHKDSSGPIGPQLSPFSINSFQNSTQPTVEHFQDDLRSGAFQFIESSSLRDLPLPYQIQIIDNDIGVICWRYPLPRALHKIKIFPVPFQTANQVTIVCKIEFYSQLKSKFEEFCEFSLAENETKLLDLKQNRPSAEVWRIKIPKVFLKRDSDDEDEGGDYEFQMHPKVLVACLRIDSYYVSSAIPNIDVFLDLKHAELNVMNKVDKEVKIQGIIPGNFQLLDDRGKEHEAGKLVVKNLLVFGQLFDEGYENFEVDAKIGVDVIDYGCGNLVPIIEEFRFKSLLNLHQNDVNFNLMTDKIQMKYSPAIGHSLITTKKFWELVKFQEIERTKTNDNFHDNQELSQHLTESLDVMESRAIRVSNGDVQEPSENPEKFLEFQEKFRKSARVHKHLDKSLEGQKLILESGKINGSQELEKIPELSEIETAQEFQGRSQNGFEFPEIFKKPGKPNDFSENTELKTFQSIPGIFRSSENLKKLEKPSIIAENIHEEFDANNFQESRDFSKVQESKDFSISQESKEFLNVHESKDSSKIHESKDSLKIQESRDSLKVQQSKEFSKIHESKEFSRIQDSYESFKLESATNSELLQSSTQPLHTKFIVCNNTASPIGISQHQTNEMICLMPQTFVLYHFRTDKFEQLLQLCVCLKGVWSVKTLPFSILSECVEFVKLEKNQVFIVTVKSVTNYQRRVTIDGTVAIFNMTKEIFRVQYKRYDKDIDSPDKSESLEFDLDGHRNGSVFGTCVADSQQSLRLRMAKIEKKVLSGEIPLREIVVNNKPWLVKVPSMSPGGFTSFWVRIIRETANEISRVVVMIWPMFVVKSLMPIDTIVYEAAQDLNYSIAGQGETRELDMSGTHEDEHELLLKGNYAMIDKEEAKVVLSYKLINRNSFFKIPDEFSNINKTVEMLETKADEAWPCARDEEVSSKDKIKIV